MTDRDMRRILVDLSVVAVSALILAASYLVIIEVDQQREQRREPAPQVIRHQAAQQRPAPTQQYTTRRPPVRGVRQPVRRQPVRRKIIVRRRSRAS